mmetsp:Transcript_18687/g.22905  ORF Transcript_18687/g.22905 Transcript_18687/m.22905 type:complete len:438 (+) Transcript_18687:180-1493(+)
MSSSPQRPREHGSPLRQGGYPPGMYQGFPPVHHYPGAPMPMKDYDASPQRFGPPPPQGHFGPQGFHPSGGPMGQYGYYGAYGGPAPHGPGYYPPHPEFVPRGGGGAFNPHFLPQDRHPPSPNRRIQSRQSSSSPPNQRPSPPPDLPSSSSSPTPPQQKSGSTPSPKSRASQNNKVTTTETKSAEKSEGATQQQQEEEEAVLPAKTTSSSSPGADNEQSQSTDYDEQLTPGVNAMRSDFHFFASDHKEEAFEKIRKEASDSKTTTFQTMTSLNERVLRMWEDASPRTRTIYMQKEEADRYRFMSEDEIASRHCATLTSRFTEKNPTPPKVEKGVANVVTKDEEDESQERTSRSKRAQPETQIEVDKSPETESPTKKVRSGNGNDNDMSNGDNSDEGISAGNTEVPEESKVPSTNIEKSEEPSVGKGDEEKKKTEDDKT